MDTGAFGADLLIVVTSRPTSVEGTVSFHSGPRTVIEGSLIASIGLKKPPNVLPPFLGLM